MFKLRYNVLALIQIFINLINYFLLIKIFGISAATDAYLIVSAIFGALILVQMLPIEQFLFFYNDLKAKSKKEAYNFYNTVLTLAFATGILTFLLSYYGNDIIVGFFINENMTAERIRYISIFFQIAILELVVTPVQLVNQKLMNAEMNFSSSYILNIIPSIFILITILYIYYSHNYAIILLIYAKVFGAFCILPLSFLILKKMGIPLKFTLHHILLKEFIIKSFKMRLGHNIHNLLFTPITTNLLTSMPSGYASYFYYAMKIASINNSIIVGPIANVFQSNFSMNWSEGKINSAKKILMKYMKISIPLLMISSSIGYFLLPYALHFITNKLSDDQILIIQMLFVGLMIWHMIILVESGSVFILIVENMSVVFIYVNILFLILYFILSKIFIECFTIYGLILALLIAQTINLILYIYYGQKILKLKEKEYES